MSAKKFDFKKLSLFNDTVIAKPAAQKEVGGIIVPNSSQEQKTKSVVVAVGPGRFEGDERRKMRVKVGDVIFHSQSAGSETNIEGEKYLVMSDHPSTIDILGLFTGNRPIDIQPFDDRVLLEWEEGLGEYKNTGIVRAKTGMDRHYTGIVLAVGPDAREIKVGQRVFFDQFCGPERIDFEEKRYAFIFEANIYCVLPSRTEMEVLSQ